MQDLKFSQRAAKVKERYSALKAKKQVWINTWQLVGLYVQPSKQDFYGHQPEGQIMSGRMFDSTASRSAQQAASSITGSIWPNGPKSFQMAPPDDMDDKQAQSQEIADWFSYVNKTMYSLMDNPDNGLHTSMIEYMQEQLTIGTSGIFVEENFNPATMTEVPVCYHALDAKRICISEGPNHFVDTVYIETSYTVKQMIQEYGIDSVSSEVRAHYENSRTEEKIKVLHAIEPRIDGVPNLFGNRNLPVASIHIELNSNKILKESGYAEMPAFITRFWKYVNEVYGRSPATENMPDIIEANILREAVIVAVEKSLNPPLILHDDGTLGGGVFDTSANAVNIRNASGRMADAQKLVEQIYDTGDISIAEKRILELQSGIEQAYFIDRLNDLGNDTRMTLGEANMRNEMRGQSLSSTYARQISELLNRLVKRTFHIMLSKNLFGYVRNSQEWIYQLHKTGVAPRTIPDAIAQRMMTGGHAYKVLFISPAMRILRSEELLGLQSVKQTVADLGQIAPSVANQVNWTRFFKRQVELTGAPQDILNSTEEVAQIEQQQQAQQQAMMDAQTKEQGALTAKHLGQAAKATAESGIPPLALIQNG